MNQNELKELNKILKDYNKQAMTALNYIYQWTNPKIIEEKGINAANDGLRINFANFRDANEKIEELLNSKDNLSGLEIDFPMIGLFLKNVNFSGVRFTGGSIDKNEYPYLYNQVNPSTNKLGFVGCNIQNSTFTRCRFNDYSFSGIKKFPDNVYEIFHAKKPKGFYFKDQKMCFFGFCDFSNSIIDNSNISHSAFCDCNFKDTCIYNSKLMNNMMSFYLTYQGKKVLDYPKKIENSHINNFTLYDTYFFERSNYTQLISSYLTSLNVKRSSNNVDLGGLSFSIKDKKFLKKEIERKLQENNTILTGQTGQTGQKLSDVDIETFISSDKNSLIKMNNILQENGSDFICFTSKLNFNGLKESLVRKNYSDKVDLVDAIEKIIVSNQETFLKYCNMPPQMINNAIVSTIINVDIKKYKSVEFEDKTRKKQNVPKESIIFSELIRNLDKNLTNYQTLFEDLAGTSGENRGRHIETKGSKTIDSDSNNNSNNANLGACDFRMPDSRSSDENRASYNSHSYNHSSYSENQQSSSYKKTNRNEGKSRNGMVKKNGTWIPDNSDFSAARYAAEMADRLDRRRRDRKNNRIKMERQRQRRSR